MANTQDTDRFHTVVVKVENKAGVLARVAGLFARRGFNIDSLAVAPAYDENFSHITFVVDAESAPLEQVVKQLDKLINVVEIHQVDPATSVQRELMIVTISTVDGDRDQVVALGEKFDADVLADSGEAIMLTLSDTPSRVDDFEEQLGPFGILEVHRTGPVALNALAGAS